MNYITPEIKVFKQYLADNHISGLALDIDNTLSQTNQYWYQKFTQIFGNPENLSSDAFFEKYHLIENAPYYQTQEAKDFIYSYVNSPELYQDLEILDNSNHFVNQVHQIVPIVAYITMRPQLIADTTKHWLDRHQFPKAQLISRPDKFLFDTAPEWKSSVLEELFPHIIGIVDDSLSVVTKMSSNYLGKIYLYNSPDNNFRTDINVISCPDWQCVFQKIKADLSS